MGEGGEFGVWDFFLKHPSKLKKYPKNGRGYAPGHS